MQGHHTSSDRHYIFVWLCSGAASVLGNALGHGEPQLHVDREFRLLHGSLLAPRPRREAQLAGGVR